MNRFTIITLLALTIMCAAACSNKNDNMKMLVKKYIVANNMDGCEIEIAKMSEPDSTFGISYMTEEEIMYVAQQVDKTYNYIMEKTKGEKDYDFSNPKMTLLMNKQMLVASHLNEIMAKSAKKGPHNGWKIRVKYSVKDKQGKDNKEQWFFLDKEGELIYSTLELNLP